MYTYLCFTLSIRITKNYNQVLTVHEVMNARTYLISGVIRMQIFYNQLCTNKNCPKMEGLKNKI